MTEISVKTVRLPPALEDFVLQWGEMGGQWGVNRSVSQIHALLFVSEKPLTAEDIAQTLGIARSNVSNSLKELVAWELIRRVPVRGDRREHFEAETDVWEIVMRIAKGRKAREIDPALAALRSSVTAADNDPEISNTVNSRLKAMLAFTEAADAWSAQMLTVPKPKLAAAMRLGAKVIALIPAKKTKT
jgi:DNA-binding transcriptional regulator GbsR (MarR family)